MTPTTAIAKLQSAVVWPRAALGGGRGISALAGTTVLVTGASSGIGRGCALLLGANDVNVLALARPSPRLDEAVAAIRAHGGRATAIRCDLSDPVQVAATVRGLDDTRIDAVVSNAGISIYRSIRRAGERSDLERSLAVNLTGPAQLLLGLVPSMIASGGGTLVNVSTVSAKPPPAPGWGSYQSTKAAFDVWLRSAAIEWARDGVTVRSVYMPLVSTPMTAAGGLYARAPALTADEAASIVAGAILRGRRRVAPWWLVWQDLAATAAPALFDAALGRFLPDRAAPP